MGPGSRFSPRAATRRPRQLQRLEVGLVATMRNCALPDGDGTRVTVRHDGFADGDAAAEHVRGWNDCLDRLAGAL